MYENIVTSQNEKLFPQQKTDQRATIDRSFKKFVQINESIPVISHHLENPAFSFVSRQTVKKHSTGLPEIKEESLSNQILQYVNNPFQYLT